MGESDTRIEQLVLGELKNNVWLITDDREVLIVDASNEAAAIAAATRNYTPVGIVLTHGHFDHINAAPELRVRTDTPVSLHPDDGFLWQKQHGETQYDRPLADGQELYVGTTRIQILHTPGHTPGSTCYYIEALSTILTGDTLFPEGPGATRWNYSDFDAIIKSIQDKLFTLPDKTRVLPGHGPSTTIGQEKPKLEKWIERGW